MPKCHSHLLYNGTLKQKIRTQDKLKTLQFTGCQPNKMLIMMTMTNCFLTLPIYQIPNYCKKSAIFKCYNQNGITYNFWLITIWYAYC